MSTTPTCTACGHHRFPGERCQNCARLKREAAARADTSPKPGSIFYTPRNAVDRKLHRQLLKERNY